MSIECKGRKNRRIKKINQIKIKWTNKKPIEPRKLSKTMCLENDKQRKENVFFLTCNGRNQETRGNCNEKLKIRKMKIIKKIA